MSTLARIFLILGVASVTYGLARWQIITEVKSKQRVQFEQFIAAHSGATTNRISADEIEGLQHRVRLCLGIHTDYLSQAIPGVAVGLTLFATAFYFGQKSE